MMKVSSLAAARCSEIDIHEISVGKKTIHNYEELMSDEKRSADAAKLSLLQRPRTMMQIMELRFSSIKKTLDSSAHEARNKKMKNDATRANTVS